MMSIFVYARQCDVYQDKPFTLCDFHCRRILFGRHGESRTTFQAKEANYLSATARI